MRDGQRMRELIEARGEGRGSRGAWRKGSRCAAGPGGAGQAGAQGRRGRRGQPGGIVCGRQACRLRGSRWRWRVTGTWQLAGAQERNRANEADSDHGLQLSCELIRNPVNTGPWLPQRTPSVLTRRTRCRDRRRGRGCPASRSPAAGSRNTAIYARSLETRGRGPEVTGRKTQVENGRPPGAGGGAGAEQGAGPGQSGAGLVLSPSLWLSV